MSQGIAAERDMPLEKQKSPQVSNVPQIQNMMTVENGRKVHACPDLAEVSLVQSKTKSKKFLERKQKKIKISSSPDEDSSSQNTSVSNKKQVTPAESSSDLCGLIPEKKKSKRRTKKSRSMKELSETSDEGEEYLSSLSVEQSQWRDILRQKPADERTEELGETDQEEEVQSSLDKHAKVKQNIKHWLLICM